MLACAPLPRGLAGARLGFGAMLLGEPACWSHMRHAVCRVLCQMPLRSFSPCLVRQRSGSAFHGVANAPHALGSSAYTQQRPSCAGPLLQASRSDRTSYGRRCSRTAVSGRTRSGSVRRLSPASPSKPAKPRRPHKPVVSRVARGSASRVSGGRVSDGGTGVWANGETQGAAHSTQADSALRRSRIWSWS